MKNYICSFVKRERKLSNKQKETLKILLKKRSINFKKTFLSLGKIFQNNLPTILEIGFGNGDSLIKAAKKNKDKNFLGIEVYKKGILNCLRKAEEKKLNNLYIIYYDAIKVLKNMIPNESLNVIQIFYPDPWKKKNIIKEELFKNILLKFS